MPRRKDLSEVSLQQALAHDDRQRLIAAATKRGIIYDPENENAFLWEVALRAAREAWPDFRAGHRIDTEWTDERYAELMADLWTEQRRYGGSERSIAALFTTPGNPYAERWATFSLSNIRGRIVKAKQSRLVRAALAHPPLKQGEPNPIDALIERYGLFGNKAEQTRE